MTDAPRHHLPPRWLLHPHPRWLLHPHPRWLLHPHPRWLLHHHPRWATTLWSLQRRQPASAAPPRCPRAPGFVQARQPRSRCGRCCDSSSTRCSTQTQSPQTRHRQQLSCHARRRHCRRHDDRPGATAARPRHWTASLWSTTPFLSRSPTHHHAHLSRLPPRLPPRLPQHLQRLRGASRGHQGPRLAPAQQARRLHSDQTSTRRPKRRPR